MTEMPTYGGLRGSVETLPAHSPATITNEWVDLGVCAEIASTSQPPISRMILQLQPYRDHVFLGYGEWDIGLDACDLLAWNTETKTFDTVASAIATDAFWSLRVVNDAFWALVTDPAVGTDPDAVVVTATAVHVLTSNQVNPWHLFDIQAWSGALFLAGANRVNTESRASVWRSLDNGETWEIVLDVADNQRIHGLFALEDGFYAVGLNGITWQTTDGVSWRPISVNLLPSEAECVRPWTFANQVVYRAGWNAFGPQNLYSYDGQTVTTIAPPWSIYDAFCDGESLVTLTAGGEVMLTTDMITWNAIADAAPSDARSVCLQNEHIYVGTADSHLWQHPRP